MITRPTLWAAIAAAASFVATPAHATDTAALLKDLTAVIMIHGQTCGPVVSAVRQSDNDYLASCTDGARYRVFTNDKGRVIVEKK